MGRESVRGESPEPGFATLSRIECAYGRGFVPRLPGSEPHFTDQPLKGVDGEFRLSALADAGTDG